MDYYRTGEDILDCITIKGSKLNGSIVVPPSKSICYRAIIASGLSEGICDIKNIVLSDDIMATIGGMEALGSKISVNGNGLIVKGSSPPKAVRKEIDCMDSASTLRFLIPVALLTGDRIEFKGSVGLSRWPLGPFYDMFDSHNIGYSGRRGLPLTVWGKLKAGKYELKGNISSQFITGLMFALPLVEGDSKIVITSELESKGYINLTMDMLKKFGIIVENKCYSEFYIYGRQTYKPSDCSVEGDYSQAAFWLAAGVLGGNIECCKMNTASLQGDRVIVDIIKEMGGNISVHGDSIYAKESKIKGTVIDASDCPDLVPALSVLASCGKDTTRIINAGRLRLKESDRLKVMAEELNKIGASVRETEDGLIIEGRDMLNGGIVDSHNDHRVAMSLTVASLKCANPITIMNSGCVKKSYPDFFDDFRKLGGITYGRSMG